MVVEAWTSGWEHTMYLYRDIRGWRNVLWIYEDIWEYVSGSFFWFTGTFRICWAGQNHCPCSVSQKRPRTACLASHFILVRIHDLSVVAEDRRSDGLKGLSILHVFLGHPPVFRTSRRRVYWKQ